MRNLLRAGLTRLMKDKLFYMGLLLALLCGLAPMHTLRTLVVVKGEIVAVRQADNFLFTAQPFLGLLYAAFAGLLIGAEYEEGTMRNKLIVGCSRASVYLSQLGVCVLACLCFALATLIGAFGGAAVLSALDITFLRMSAAHALVAVAVTLGAAAALACVFSLLAMLCSSRPISIVAGVLLAIGLLLAGAVIYNRLCEPEMTSSMMLTINGMERAEPQPNTMYVAGRAREALQFIEDCLPTGQMIQLSNLELARPVLSLCGSAIIALTATLAGLLAFSRKDIR